MPIAQKEINAGVHIVNLKTKSKVGEILYDDDVEEIYDVHVLPGKLRPNILNIPMSERYRAIITPGGAQWFESNQKKS